MELLTALKVLGGALTLGVIVSTIVGLYYQQRLNVSFQYPSWYKPLAISIIVMAAISFIETFLPWNTPVIEKAFASVTIGLLLILTTARASLCRRIYLTGQVNV